MTPLPKRKVSKSARNQRRSHDHLKPIALQVCPTCKELKLPHRVCPNCGNYNGALVVDVQGRAERRAKKKNQE